MPISYSGRSYCRPKGLGIVLKVIAQIFLLAALVLSTSCLKQAPKRNSSGGSSPFNSETTPVRWPVSSFANGGLNVKIGDALLNDFVPADLDSSNHNPIEQMFKQWNSSSSSLTFLKVPADSTSNKDYGDLDSYKNDGELGIYRSDTWIPGVSSQALAVTQYIGFRRNTGTPSEYVELAHADIIINYRDYSFSTDPSSSSTYDLHSVVLHELGHFLGLAHINSFSVNSVMQPYLGLFDSQRSITPVDSSNVKNLYGLSNLTVSSSSVIVSHMTNNTDKKLPPSAVEQEDGTIHGLIELRADGECRHYENGQLTHTH